MSKLRIDAGLIEKIVREFKQVDTIRVIDVNLKGIGAKGDNYTSEVSRLLVKYGVGKNGNEVEEELSLFVKHMHTFENEQMSQWIHAVYLNEMDILAGPLRRMQNVMNTPRIAKLLYSHAEKPYFAIMEDLGVLGFSIANRATGLDLQHASIAIRSLAQFHAASVVITEKNPEYKLQFRNNLFSSEEDSSADFLVNALTSLAITIAEWKELDAKYARKLKNLTKVVFEKTRKAFSSWENEFAVLTHGDCSQLNIMFAYDAAGNPNKVALVDFQYACYNSPVVDLRYFISTSTTEAVQDLQFSLLEEYHSELSKTMKHLNCTADPPSLEALRKMYDDRIFVSAISTCLVEPIMHASSCNVVSVDTLINDVDGIKRLYQRDDYRKRLTSLLPEYDRLGLLDP